MGIDSEREIDREGERQRGRETERQRDREKEKDRQGQSEKQCSLVLSRYRKTDIVEVQGKERESAYLLHFVYSSYLPPSLPPSLIFYSHSPSPRLYPLPSSDFKSFSRAKWLELPWMCSPLSHLRNIFELLSHILISFALHILVHLR